MSISDNFKKIKESIPEHVTIVAAAKTRTADEVAELIEAGLTDIGSNYIQEAEPLFDTLSGKYKHVRWHMIGHLQKNKINKALRVSDIIQTVDSIKNAGDINTRAEKMDKTVSVLIEVNIGGESSKDGVAPEFDNIRELALKIADLKNLKLEGLMTMGPVTGSPEELRPYFREVKKIYDRLNQSGLPGIKLETLSMGMSGSYRVAIEEGSNMVRLGTILFGQRQYH